MSILELTSRDRQKLVPRKTSDAILDWLRSRILHGRFPVGSMLPPERILATELNVTRNSVRAAIARLEGEGLVEVRQGSGARVQDFREHGALGLIPHLLELGPEDRLSIVRGFLELRRGIAAEVIAWAGQRISDAQLDGLQRLADLQAAEEDLEAFIRRDVEFCRAIARAADNLPLELLYNEVQRIGRQRPEIDLLRFSDMDAVRSSYQATVDLIARRDPQLAREATRRLLEAVDEQALRRIEASGDMDPA